MNAISITYIITIDGAINLMFRLIWKTKQNSEMHLEDFHSYTYMFIWIFWLGKTCG